MPRLAFALTLAATSLASIAAHAQPALTAPTPEAAPAPAPAPALPHWSIGLGLSSIAIAPTGSQDAGQTYRGGEVELRYRIAAHWELGVAFGGGNDVLPDGSDGDRVVGMSLLTARYHLAPYATWDLFASAGLGAGVVGVRQSGAPEPKMDRSVGSVGLGLERRFGHIGVTAELRAFGMSPAKSDAQAQPKAGTLAQTVGTVGADDGYGGGSFTLAASYEF